MRTTTHKLVTHIATLLGFLAMNLLPVAGLIQNSQAASVTTLAPLPTTNFTVAPAPIINIVEAPKVFWNSQPVRPNETVMVQGHAITTTTKVEALKLIDVPPGSPLRLLSSVPGAERRPGAFARFLSEEGTEDSVC